ncbi:hypothetical protein [Janthinobacterium fluminis]|uniref:Exonuclease SbcC n=1 Tax=Janthinobacterium fluminis TaxID=2987524 RepID=A0ABT5JZH6_9BURK|nr:hypothetical protein [Janthinobacterium fluminis]MDC8758133.1 hypothetical protein [Janthinobacterium fluminis]
MKQHPSILINKLILVGRRKNYIVPFYPGVNIIYGDSATGKSSILEIINYLFGASKFVYDQEIESSVIYASMEVELNKQVYVIKRDIFDTNSNVEVTASTFDDVDKLFPKKFAANYSAAPGPDGYLSDFFLSALGVPILKVRESPSKAESSMVRLSFRDLFKFCYLKQDDVGSKQLLELGNWVLHSKNKTTFKYIFNLLDENITALEGQISVATSEKNRLENKYRSVSEFLNDTQFQSAVGLNDSYEELERQATLLDQQLQEINKTMVSDSDAYSFLRDAVESSSIKSSLLVQDRYNCEMAIERFSRLKNDYQNDITKLKAIKLAKNQIGHDNFEIFNCPICDSKLDIENIKQEHSIDESDKANHEINAFLRRTKDLEILLTGERSKHHAISMELAALNDEQIRYRRMLDVESANMITPYLSERDGVASELATLREKIRQLSHSLKIRNQQRAIFDEIERLQNNISGMQANLGILKDAAPSSLEIFQRIGHLLNKYLAKVNIKDRRDVSIGEASILPILRNREYKDITSGGLRTILSIGYFVSLFEFAIEEIVNFPSFLMVDTVGKYLGKTQNRYIETDLVADRNENISDPSKYNNMYEYMIEVAEAAEMKQQICQFILVDNDVPIGIQEKYAGFVVAHFSANGHNGLPLGLIDDAPQFA